MLLLRLVLSVKAVVAGGEAEKGAKDGDVVVSTNRNNSKTNLDKYISGLKNPKNRNVSKL